MYEIRTLPENDSILNIILYNLSQPTNHPLVQFIYDGIQDITNSDIYKTIIQKKNAFIRDNSIIPVYDIDKRDVGKIKKFINESNCIQDIELTNESK